MLTDVWKCCVGQGRACAPGANATKEPESTDPTVINLYLHAHLLCALVKIMAAVYKLLKTSDKLICKLDAELH